MRIACIVPTLHFPGNEYGHGYLPPLGLLSLAGPLEDLGHQVTLIDADAGHLQVCEVLQRLRDTGAEVVGNVVRETFALAGPRLASRRDAT